MKKLRTYFIWSLVLLMGPPVFSQFYNCLNLGFELGNFTNWTGYTWQYSTEHPEVTTLPVEGIVDKRQTIISDQDAYDPYTGYELKMIPPGYRYSCRLGYPITVPYSGSARCWNQSLRYTMTVDSSNALLILKFALVLEYAADHLMIEEPRFRFTLYNENGDTIPDCANYDVYATNETVEGFHYYVTDNEKEVMWRDWTTVGVNLMDYIGQTIIVEFMTADCTQTYHFGYGYFVASCQPLYITVGYCEQDSTALLIAPDGFERYNWTDFSGSTVDSFQILEVTDPTEGALYTCALTSATGCEVSLNSEISRYSPHAAFSSYMLDCFSNEVQLTNQSTTNKGQLYYIWDFGEEDESFEAEPLHRFITSGRHQVSLTVLNPPSNCMQVLTKEVESFSPPLVGIDGYSTYCPGESTFIKAYGAYYYTWSTGSEEDSIEVSAPGGDFILIGRSTTGCVDTNYITVTEEPDWEFLAEGDTMLCVGEITELNASGAYQYQWNTGDTTQSIVVMEPGNYQVQGLNSRGCEKVHEFNVELSLPPSVDFLLSTQYLDTRNNQLTASLNAEAGVQYFWDMGDGSTNTGPISKHTYNISNTKLFYTIMLTATDQYGCKNSDSVTVDVVPFVPNIFTPNGDGINDVFMAGLEMKIYDRSGTLLFEGANGWDGRHNGQPADPDTYFYWIVYSDSELVEHSRKGYVTLVR
jgi:gliding motility-associated-like protein